MRACILFLAATHCFDKTITETAIKDNYNPIEKMERSMLIVGTTVHNKSPAELIKPEVLDRVSTYSSILFDSHALLEEGKLYADTGKGKEKEKEKVK